MEAFNLTQDQIYTVDKEQATGRTYAVAISEEEEILLPSVTTIINFVINKPALPPWAYNIGIAATLDYIQDEFTSDEHDLAAINALNVGEVKLALQEREATHTDEMNRGASRGIEVHAVLEAIAKGEEYTYAKEYTAYVETLKQWLNDYEPEFHYSEFKVASLEHGYAGQFDGVCTIHKHPPRRKHESLVGKRVCLDVKTNSAGAVYPESHLPQVEAYSEAYEEMGGTGIDAKLVVGIGPGKYTPIVSYASFNTFKCILDLYNELQAMKSNNPNKRK